MISSRISPLEFETYVEDALASIPPAFGKYLENIVVVIEEEPTARERREVELADEDDLFGIFRGLPYFDRNASASHLPAQIAIFRAPILRRCATRREAVAEIRDTVVHEIGHMLGLADDEMPY